MYTKALIIYFTFLVIVFGIYTYMVLSAIGTDTYEQRYELACLTGGGRIIEGHCYAR